MKNVSSTPLSSDFIIFFIKKTFFVKKTFFISILICKKVLIILPGGFSVMIKWLNTCTALITLPDREYTLRNCWLLLLLDHAFASNFLIVKTAETKKKLESTFSTMAELYV